MGSRREKKKFHSLYMQVSKGRGGEKEREKGRERKREREREKDRESREK